MCTGFPSGPERTRPARTDQLRTTAALWAAVASTSPPPGLAPGSSLRSAGWRRWLARRRRLLARRRWRRRRRRTGPRATRSVAAAAADAIGLAGEGRSLFLHRQVATHRHGDRGEQSEDHPHLHARLDLPTGEGRPGHAGNVVVGRADDADHDEDHGDDPERGDDRTERDRKPD